MTGDAATDDAMATAHKPALGGDAVTAEYKINYIKPAVGEYVLARASTLSTTRTQAICQSLVYAIDGRDERLVAAAQGTIMKVHKTFE